MKTIREVIAEAQELAAPKRHHTCCGCDGCYAEDIADSMANALETLLGPQVLDLKVQAGALVRQCE